jgi:hypothetical protein
VRVFPDIDGAEGKDRPEKAAHVFLRDRFGEKVAYEPNGPATFPDFSIADKVAVEVTLLCEVERSGDKGRDSPLNITEMEPSVYRSLQEAVASAGSRDFERSFYVDCELDFRQAKNSSKQINQALSGFDRRVCGPRTDLLVSNTCTLSIWRGSSRRETEFRLSGLQHVHSDVWLLEYLSEGIKLALEKKAKCVESRDQYDEYWLFVGADFLAEPLSVDELSVIRESVGDIAPWDGLMLLNCLDPSFTQVVCGARNEVNAGFFAS